MLYFFALAIFIVQAYCYDFRNSKSFKKSSLVAATTILIVIAAFRYRVGLDTLRYMDYFDSVNASKYSEIIDNLFSGTDPLFFLIIAFIKINDGNFVWLQVVHAVFFNVTIVYFFAKQTRYIFTAIAIYFLLFYFRYNFEVLREAMAVAIFLLSYGNLVKNKILKFYTLAVVATLFHPGAIVLFVLPLVPNLGSSIRALLICLTSLPVGYYLQYNFADTLSVLSFDIRITQKILIYANTEFSASNVSFLGALQKLMLYLVVPHMLIRLIKPINGQHIEFEKYIVINYAIVIMSLQVGIFSRFSNYFIPFYIVLFAEFLGFSKNIKLTIGQRRVGIPFALLTVFFVFVLNYYSLIKVRDGVTDIYRYFPYYSIFTKSISVERENLLYHYN